MRDERVFSVVNEPQSLSIELKCWTWNIQPALWVEPPKRLAKAQMYL